MERTKALPQWIPIVTAVLGFALFVTALLTMQVSLPNILGQTAVGLFLIFLLIKNKEWSLHTRIAGITSVVIGCASLFLIGIVSPPTDTINLFGSLRFYFLAMALLLLSILWFTIVLMYADKGKCLGAQLLLGLLLDILALAPIVYMAIKMSHFDVSFYIEPQLMVCLFVPSAIVKYLAVCNLFIKANGNYDRNIIDRLFKWVVIAACCLIVALTFVTKSMSKLPTFEASATDETIEYSESGFTFDKLHWDLPEGYIVDGQTKDKMTGASVIKVLNTTGDTIGLTILTQSLFSALSKKDKIVIFESMINPAVNALQTQLKAEDFECEKPHMETIGDLDVYKATFSGKKDGQAFYGLYHIVIIDKYLVSSMAIAGDPESLPASEALFNSLSMK